MSSKNTCSAENIERSCELIVSALAKGLRKGVRLISGERRSFGMNAARSIVQIPYPYLAPDWTLRTLTCGIALQCSPSKDLIAQYPLHELSFRQRSALTIIEGEAALGWAVSQWPGLLPEFRRHMPNLEMTDAELDGRNIMDRALKLSRSAKKLKCHPLLGELPFANSKERGFLASIRRVYGRMPWSSKRSLSPSIHTLPVGGEGGMKARNLPPPSRPEYEDVEIRPDRRAGIPYPEWNVWRKSFLPNYVAVLERKHSRTNSHNQATSAELRRWFEEHTHRAMKNRLEDGIDLDVDQYLHHYIDIITGHTSDARIFRDLLPAVRDVTTAVLLDGSSSLGVHQGRIFKLELTCADALSRAMMLARERHGLFVFSGNTRHRVDVLCLKDFEDAYSVVPSHLGLSVSGYTRLGAPIRHLTSRLLNQASERRLLIVIGDGLMSDEGYEGRYAWADVAHAVEEAVEAGVTIYYIGVGPARVDPLPEVFGPRRSMRILRVEELPCVLAQVHRELVAA